jgi:hypothetical protein
MPHCASHFEHDAGGTIAVDEQLPFAQDTHPEIDRRIV